MSFSVDIHSHFLPEHWPDLEARFGTPDWPWMKQLGQGKAMLMLGQKEFRPVLDDCWNGERRIEAMDEHGIDVQVMSATPLLFAYGRPADQAREVARLFNSAAREICAHDLRRLKSLCQVPLQDTDAACAELDIAMAEG
ncbi:MAG: amidohydrolase family protein, partial [Sphingobium sp.]